MKCQIHRVTGEGFNQKVVRRKFVPIRMRINDAGGYIQEEVKLPFTASKVVGVLVTANVGKPCIDGPAPLMYYYGITGAEMEDTTFQAFDTGQELEEDRYPEILFEGEPGQYWYIAVPASDRVPFEIYEDVFQELGLPIKINIQQEGYCNPQPYHLWSKKIAPSGRVLVTFEEFT